jgi:hypothetical protein
VHLSVFIHNYLTTQHVIHRRNLLLTQLSSWFRYFDNPNVGFVIVGHQNWAPCYFDTMRTFNTSCTCICAVYDQNALLLLCTRSCDAKTTRSTYSSRATSCAAKAAPATRTTSARVRVAVGEARGNASQPQVSPRRTTTPSRLQPPAVTVAASPRPWTAPPSLVLLPLRTDIMRIQTTSLVIVQNKKGIKNSKCISR